MAEKNKELHCSFCGKSEKQVHRMIQGPGVRICDECVQLCMSILEDDYSPAAENRFCLLYTSDAADDSGTV